MNDAPDARRVPRHVMRTVGHINFAMIAFCVDKFAPPTVNRPIGKVRLSAKDGDFITLFGQILTHLRCI